MREKRRFAALLAALALAACLTAVPALATEGTPPVGYTQMPGDATGTTPQDPGTEPVEPDPVTPAPDPVTPPPSSSSSSESSSSSSESSESSQDSSSSSSSSSESSQSSQEPGGNGSSSEDPWGGITSEEPSEGGESSSSESSQEEPVWEEPSQSQEEPGDTTQQVEVPDYEPQTIATPRPAVERPSVSLNGGSQTSSESTEESGPNYVTFARLNVRGNSMGSTLFVGGVASIAVGVLGLVAILLLYLRGRRRYAGAEGILEEIHEAEVRQQPAQGGGAPYQETPPPAPRRNPPPSGAVVPEEASLYTEEFSVPQDQYPPQEEYDQYGEYDEYGDYEDYGEYDNYDGPYEEEGQYGQYRDQEVPYEEPYDDYQDGTYDQDYPAEPQPPEPEDVMGQTRQFDTEEILREALRFTEDDPKK
ncbi:MAG: hypothetical protein ACOYJZ_07605 [Acutalibacter sp.]|jgi:hypothetical protein